MNISSISSTTPLLKQLESNGLSADKAKLVESDIAASEKAVSAAGTGPIAPSVRVAIDSKIASDVQSGKLSESDAAAVKKTLDTMSGQAAADQGASATKAKSGGAGHAGGGGGGAAAKTETSETVTISGSTKTTVITYSDDSTTTVTATATEADKARYAKPSATDSSDAAKDYAPKIEPGLLVDQVA